MWRDDLSGRLLFNEVLDAAERGVRVRLLLDDNNTVGMDAVVAFLDAHPNAEVRLFNPFRFRGIRSLSYLTDFGRVNRRMHNKSFTVDNQATVVGGRNIADEYFDAGDDLLFQDVDLIAIGEVVSHVSADFDRYWASGSAYPVSKLLPAAEVAPGARLSLDEVAARPTTAPQENYDPDRFLKAIRESKLMQAIEKKSMQFEWARVRLVSDDPAKGLGNAPESKLLTHALENIIGEPKSQLDIVSPYFVPTGEGAQAFTAMAEHGVNVRVLTNAYEATDVGLVHSGYAKWRKTLLAAGVALYETKAASSADSPGLTGLAGSSASSLHAKVFAVDRKRLFVGSFNFDPRSSKLNSELGFVIDSPDMAAQLSAAFDEEAPLRAYELSLDDDAIIWSDTQDGQTHTYSTEPGTNFFDRMGIRILSFLPIDWLL